MVFIDAPQQQPRSVLSELSPLRALTALALRLGAGVLLLDRHAWPQVRQGWEYVWTKAPWPFIDRVDALGYPFAPVLACVVAGAAFLAAWALILGVVTRLSAMILFLLSVPAIFAAIRSPEPFFFEATALYAMTFLGLFLLGPGALSIDAILTRRRPRRRKRPLA